jgi:hypothetical protein
MKIMTKSISGIRRQIGVSLVEMIVAVAVIGFIAISSILALQMITKASVSTNLEGMAHIKMRAVSEEIRREAADFDNMSETPNIIRLPDLYPRIHVISTTSPIDPATRSRLVRITGSWKGISEELKTITSTFTVIGIRGKLDGGKIKIKVVNALTGMGVEGVGVTIEGQDSLPISDLTDANGVWETSGAKLGTDIPLSINGQLVTHFFVVNSSSASFSKSLLVVCERSGTNTTHYDTPIEIYPPAKITGTVVEKTNSSTVGYEGVSDVELVLVNKPNTQIITVGLPNNIKFVKTDAEGNFTFNGIMPTKCASFNRGAGYEVFVLGSSMYAALASHNDRTAGTKPTDYNGWEVAECGQVVSKATFHTIKKGSIKGEVYYAKGVPNGSGSDWSVDTFVPAAAIRAIRTNSESFVSGSPEIQLNHLLSFVWHYYFANASRVTYPRKDVGYDSRTTGSNGTFNFSYISPLITRRDYPTTATLQAQYNKVTIVPRTPTHYPLTPILLTGEIASGNSFNPATVSLLSGAGNTSIQGALVQNGHLSDFQSKLNNNTMVEKRIYFLHADSLVQVNGDIAFYESDGVTPASPTPIFSKNTVSSMWGEDGYGRIYKYTNNTMQLHKSWGISTEIHFAPNSHMHYYQMGTSAIYLPPNTVNTQTVLHFHGVTATTNPYKFFQAYVFAIKKIRNLDGNFQFVPIPKNEINGPLTVDVWVYKGGWQIIGEDKIVNMIDGEMFSANDVVTPPTEHTFKGSSSPLVLQPGTIVDHKNAALGQPADIKAIRQPSEPLVYAVTIKHSNTQIWATTRGDCTAQETKHSNQCGPHFHYSTAYDRFLAPEGYRTSVIPSGVVIDYNTAITGATDAETSNKRKKLITLYRIATAPTISGRVYIDGAPTANITGLVTRSGYSSNLTINTDTDGRFSFTNTRFVPSDGNNITITVEFDGTSETLDMELADGESWTNADFHFWRTGGGGGGGL